MKINLAEATIEGPDYEAIRQRAERVLFQYAAHGLGPHVPEEADLYIEFDIARVEHELTTMGGDLVAVTFKANCILVAEWTR